MLAVPRGHTCVQPVACSSSGSATATTTTTSSSSGSSSGSSESSIESPSIPPCGFPRTPVHAPCPTVPAGARRSCTAGGGGQGLVPGPRWQCQAQHARQPPGARAACTWRPVPRQSAVATLPTNCCRWLRFAPAQQRSMPEGALAERPPGGLPGRQEGGRQPGLRRQQPWRPAAQTSAGVSRLQLQGTSAKDAAHNLLRHGGSPGPLMGG